MRTQRRTLAKRTCKCTQRTSGLQRRGLTASSSLKTVQGNSKRFFCLHSFWFLSFKCANGCADKAAEAQLLNIQIMTIWSPAEAGKSVVDSQGSAFAKCAREKLTVECAEEHVDSRNCANLACMYNKNHRVPHAPRKNSRVKDRVAVHLTQSDLQALRHEMAHFCTLVIT